MKKALYLKESDNWTLTWDDACFYIARQGKAPRSIPFASLERVILMGHFPLDTTLLMRLINQDITVSLVDNLGLTVAVCTPAYLSYKQLRFRQKKALETPKHQQFLMAWHRKWKHYLDRQCAISLRLDLPERNMRKSLCNAIKKRLKEHERDAWELARRKITSLMFSLVHHHLQTMELDQSLGLFQQGKPFSFTWEVVHLFTGEIFMQALRYAQSGSPSERVLIERFEKRAQFFRPHLYQMMGEYLRILETIEDVPLLDLL